MKMNHLQKSLKSLLGAEKGQSLVEMALVLPILLLFLMGIVEFGRIFNAYLTVAQAAREGARVGVVGGSDLQIESVVETVASGSLDPDRVTVVITPGDGGRARGDSLRVEVSFPVEIETPIISNLIGGSVTVRNQSVMRVE